MSYACEKFNQARPPPGLVLSTCFSRSSRLTPIRLLSSSLLAPLRQFIVLLTAQWSWQHARKRRSLSLMNVQPRSLLLRPSPLVLYIALHYTSFQASFCNISSCHVAGPFPLWHSVCVQSFRWMSNRKSFYQASPIFLQTLECSTCTLLLFLLPRLGRGAVVIRQHGANTGINRRVQGQPVPDLSRHHPFKDALAKTWLPRGSMGANCSCDAHHGTCA